MQIALRCPCGANLKADMKFVGREMKCPKCSTKLIVPEPPMAIRSEPDFFELEDLGAAQPPASQRFHSQPNPAQAPYQQHAGARAGTNTKPATAGNKKFSWILTGSIVGVVSLSFFAFLGYIYFQQRSQLEKDKGIIYEGKRRTIVSEMDPSGPRRLRPDQLPPAQKNEFDGANKELYDPSVSGKDTDLEMADLIDMIEPSIVRLKVVSDEGEGVGSGCFIDREGKIVTNYHVVQGAVDVTVTTADGKQTKALGFIIVQPQKDLAIIQIDPKTLNIVPIAIAKEMPRRGEEVAAFGAPEGFSFSATKGIISAIRPGTDVQNILLEMNNQDIYGILGYSIDTKWIQSSAAISGGNSGGPLVNMRGEMVGINTWTHPGGQNLNFASTVDEIEKIFKSRTTDLHDFVRLPPNRIGR